MLDMETIYCPKCQEPVWDRAAISDLSGYKLNKCHNCRQAFDNESALTVEELET